MSLDRGTKIYATVLGTVLLLSLLAWLLTYDFRLGEIDKMLQDDPEIGAYPYPYRALEIVGGHIQSKVRNLVMSRSDIEKVSWRIDKEWFSSKGILLD
ncbi:MAG: hypothetical protein P8179_22785 [Candidatus Thiodiazotropha sp.]